MNENFDNLELYLGKLEGKIQRVEELSGRIDDGQVSDLGREIACAMSFIASSMNEIHIMIHKNYTRTNFIVDKNKLTDTDNASQT